MNFQATDNLYLTASIFNPPAQILDCVQILRAFSESEPDSDSNVILQAIAQERHREYYVHLEDRLKGVLAKSRYRHGETVRFPVNGKSPCYRTR